MKTMTTRTQRITRLLVGAVLLVACAGASGAQETGEQTFARICKACHTIGQGRLVGPDLAGVTARRSREWIVSFVQSSQAMIKSGDADAVALFQEYNELIMPDNSLDEAQVMAVMDFVDGAAGEGVAVVDPGPVLENVTAADIARGADLFRGRERLSSGGSACNACHHVADEDMFAGGTLARDLTEVVGRIGVPGVMAILKAPPYPVMTRAYVDHPLTEDEVVALAAYLREVDQAGSTAGTSIGRDMLLVGIVGTLVLLGFYSFVWLRRKRHLVYGEILGRQDQVAD